ncbi:protein NUCLEAR FUSION DEFECTIVE 4-like [Nicotiana tabacum]|uniref:Protein NUCLEAR FUSION DEFECTIVE 4-like n=1 Tax=Nicotiana tabacum TaxID=4097 RepID=A0A1S3XCI6_TOBAC|nr:PREDICTED: protein NUCLEAR FUSION DEFECTIVE 4-like [Nicotiana tabacum]
MAMPEMTRDSVCRAIWSFSLHLLTSRWFMTFSSLMILSMAGATFIFGLYSGEIKSSLGYDQTTLNLISFFKDLGGNLAIISGLIMEIIPPRAVLAIGAILNVFGYFMIWLAVTGRISKPHVWQMCLYICIGANSQSFANTGATVTCVKNFPNSRGIVLGLLKGAVGLSGAIMTQLYLAFYGDNGKSLILLISWFPVLVSFFFLPAIRIMKVTRQENEVKMLYNLLYFSLGLAGFLLIMIIIQRKLTFDRAEYSLSGAVVLVLIFSPLVLIIREEVNLWKSKRQVATNFSQLNVSIQMENIPSSAEPESTTNWKSCFKNAFKPPKRGEDHTILQALFNIDMLILFVVTTFGVGGTLTAIDNLGQIGKSYAINFGYNF